MSKCHLATPALVTSGQLWRKPVCLCEGPYLLLLQTKVCQLFLILTVKSFQLLTALL